MSSIEVNCPQCGHPHRVNVSMAGRGVRCSRCDATVQVPESSGPVPAAGTGTGVGGADVVEAEPVEAVPLEPQLAKVEPVQAQPANAATETSTGRVSAPLEENGDAVLFHDVEQEELLKRKKRDEEELDMTPMVDVTFLLLIFFMVTASFSLQKSIRVPRQTSDMPSLNVNEEVVDELDVVELEIDQFGGFYVIAPEFEEETPGKQNLIRTLKRAIGGAQSGMQLKIRVHEMASLQSLVDGMDAGTIAGFSEVDVSEVENL